MQEVVSGGEPDFGEGDRLAEDNVHHGSVNAHGAVADPGISFDGAEGVGGAEVFGLGVVYAFCGGGLDVVGE